jgi:uncharacterized alkaline shock family protein YloU
MEKPGGAAEQGGPWGQLVCLQGCIVAPQQKNASSSIKDALTLAELLLGSHEDGHVAIDLHVVVEQGVNIASVTQNLASGVKFLLKQIAELDNVDVRIHVEGMRVH